CDAATRRARPYSKPRGIQGYDPQVRDLSFPPSRSHYDEDGLRLAATPPLRTPEQAFVEARKIADNKVRARENSSPDRGKRQAMAGFEYAMRGDNGLSNEKEDPRSSYRQGMWSNLHRPSLIKFSSRAVLAIRSPLVR